MERNNNKTVSTQAKSLDLAIVQAASALGTTSDNIEYKVVSQSSGGFLGLFGSRKVEISAWVKKPARRDRPERQERGPQGRRPQREPRQQEHRGETNGAAPAEQLPPLTASEQNALVEELRAFCADICTNMAGEPVDVVATVDGDRLLLNVKNSFVTEQLTKNIKLAESLEHILRKKPRHLKRELPFRIFVDADGMRKSREDELKEMAQDLSQKVYTNKKPIVLNYKSAYDRKIIHMALDQDDRVYTKSIGSGPNRKLMILPAKDGQGFRQENATL